MDYHKLLKWLSPSNKIDLIIRASIICILCSSVFSSIKVFLGLPIYPFADTIVVSLTATPFYLVVAMGVIQWRESHAELFQIATTDALTGLMNRRAFFEALENSEAGALLVVDIDHFKSVNDRYGHAVGDAVLLSVGDHLSRNIRSGDLLCRLGGEEFGVYLFNADCMVLDIIAERICKGYVLYNHDVPAPIKVKMSAGGAYAAMSPTCSELYRRADQALYDAKRSGRARMHLWQPSATSRF